MHIRAATMADAAGIARVHVESWRTTYAGIVPDAYLADLSYEAREARWDEHLCGLAADQCVFVALDYDERVVGFAGGGPQRTTLPGYTGELYAIYLLRASLRQGLGRRLASRVAAHLVEHEIRAMVVWVLSANPSRPFYEALGGQLLAEQPIEIGGAPLHEVAYGWPDAARLFAPESLP